MCGVLACACTTRAAKVGRLPEHTVGGPFLVMLCTVLSWAELSWVGICFPCVLVFHFQLRASLLLHSSFRWMSATATADESGFFVVWCAMCASCHNQIGEIFEFYVSREIFFTKLIFRHFRLWIIRILELNCEFRLKTVEFSRHFDFLVVFYQNCVTNTQNSSIFLFLHIFGWNKNIYHEISYISNRKLRKTQK